MNISSSINNNYKNESKYLNNIQNKISYYSILQKNFIDLTEEIRSLKNQYDISQSRTSKVVRGLLGIGCVTTSIFLLTSPYLIVISVTALELANSNLVNKLHNRFSSFVEKLNFSNIFGNTLIIIIYATPILIGHEGYKLLKSIFVKVDPKVISEKEEELRILQGKETKNSFSPPTVEDLDTLKDSLKRVKFQIRDHKKLTTEVNELKKEIKNSQNIVVKTGFTLLAIASLAASVFLAISPLLFDGALISSGLLLGSSFTPLDQWPRYKLILSNALTIIVFATPQILGYVGIKCFQKAFPLYLEKTIKNKEIELNHLQRISDLEETEKLLSQSIAHFSKTV